MTEQVPRRRHNRKKKRAILITFEGSEGTGKSSIISSLGRFLKRRGFRVCLFREPGSTKVGEKIREILLDKKNVALSPHTELLLYLAARTQLIEEKLNSAFKKCDFIIGDRFFDSTLVYQGYALGLGRIVEDAVRLFCLGVVPDLTIIFDTDVRESLKRVKQKDRIESRSLRFHRRLRRGYRKLAARYPERICLVAADKSLDDIFDKTKEIVTAFLWKKEKRKL
jgi:dTMP kinase